MSVVKPFLPLFTGKSKSAALAVLGCHDARTRGACVDVRRSRRTMADDGCYKSPRQAHGSETDRITDPGTSLD